MESRPRCDSSGAPGGSRPPPPPAGSAVRRTTLTMTGTQRLGIYMRVSSDDQADRGTIQTQADQVDRWLRAHPSFEDVDRYSDDGVSGMVPLSQRPNGGRLIRDAAAGRLDAVLVYQVDRLGRNAIDLLGVRRLLETLNVRLLSVVEGEPDLLGFDVQAVVGDHYRREFLRRSADGMARAAQEGRYTGGIVPYGFRVEGKKQTARLVPDEVPVAGELTAAGVIRRIFDRLGLGHASCPVVADELNALGVPTHYARDCRGIRGARTRGRWTAARIRNMTINPVYAGDLQYGRRTTKRDRAVISAPIEGLVSRALWQAAQETLARNRRVVKNSTRAYLLRGAIRCAECGLTYVGSQGQKGVGWYRCGGRNRDRGPLLGRCIGPMVRTEALDPVVWADLERLLRNPGDVLDDLAQERDGGAAVAEAEAITLRRALARLDDEQGRAINLVVRGTLPDSALQPEFDRIQAERARLEARLAAVDGPGAPGLPDSAIDLLSDVRARLDATLPIEAQQEIVRLLVGRIVVHRDVDAEGKKVVRAVVDYRFPGALLVDTDTDSWRRRAGSGRAGREIDRPARLPPAPPPAVVEAPRARPARIPAARRGTGCLDVRGSPPLAQGRARRRPSRHRRSYGAERETGDACPARGSAPPPPPTESRSWSGRRSGRAGAATRESCGPGASCPIPAGQPGGARGHRPGRSRVLAEPPPGRAPRGGPAPRPAQATPLVLPPRKWPRPVVRRGRRGPDSPAAAPLGRSGSPRVPRPGPQPGGSRFDPPAPPRRPTRRGRRRGPRRVAPARRPSTGSRAPAEALRRAIIRRSAPTGRRPEPVLTRA
jgi:site-specific DNA recombinase